MARGFRLSRFATISAVISAAFWTRLRPWMRSANARTTGRRGETLCPVPAFDRRLGDARHRLELDPKNLSSILIQNIEVTARDAALPTGDPECRVNWHINLALRFGDPCLQNFRRIGRLVVGWARA
jgi:hypothetical protein